MLHCHCSPMQHHQGWDKDYMWITVVTSCHIISHYSRHHIWRKVGPAKRQWIDLRAPETRLFRTPKTKHLKKEQYEHHAEAPKYNIDGVNSVKIEKFRLTSGRWQDHVRIFRVGSDLGDPTIVSLQDTLQVKGFVSVSHDYRHWFAEYSAISHPTQHWRRQTAVADHEKEVQRCAVRKHNNLLRLFFTKKGETKVTLSIKISFYFEIITF